MTIDNHPLTPKPVDDREAGVDYHQVLPVDREAYLSLNMLPEKYTADARAGRWDNVTGVQAFARHREQAERGLREALRCMVKAYSDPEAGEVDRRLALIDARKALDTRL